MLAGLIEPVTKIYKVTQDYLINVVGDMVG
jgi:hypothetical protein